MPEEKVLKISIARTGFPEAKRDLTRTILVG
jgi:hypothetical protein